MNDKTFKLLGSHGNEARADLDFYSTDPKALEELLKVHSFDNVWENACGNCDLVQVLANHGILRHYSDIVSRRPDIEQLNFLTVKNMKWKGDIITNPPFNLAQQFVEKGLGILQDGSQMAYLLRIQFLEGKRRGELFDKYPPKYVYVSRSRIQCHRNGIIDHTKSSAMCLCWFVWEKGWSGETVIRWFN